jgi:hypothetical protein
MVNPHSFLPIFLSVNDYLKNILFNPYSFQGVLYIFKYCMLYRIFETNGSVILINAIVFLNKCLPTDPSVGTNNG